jgi:hypothetical protein
LALETRRKSLKKKNPYKFKKRYLKKYVSTAAFLSPFLSEANNFRRILNHILIGLYIPMPGIKNQRGGSRETFLSYLVLKVSVPFFSRNRCAVSTTNRISVLWHGSMDPLPLSWQADGQTSAGSSSLTF